VGLQQLSQFVLHADHALMAFLLRDVLLDLFHVRHVLAAWRKPIVRNRQNTEFSPYSEAGW